MRCTDCNIALPADARFCAQCGRPAAPLAPPSAPPTKTLVVLAVVVLAVVAIGTLGIITAIAVPNLLNALDRGKQKRTMADLRTIAEAVEAYASAHGGNPIADDFDDLLEALGPQGASLPKHDGWGKPLLAMSDGEHYAIVSTGKDGVSDGCDGGGTSDFDADICFADGELMQWPEGVQR